MRQRMGNRLLIASIAALSISLAVTALATPTGGCTADVNGSGTVDVEDLIIVVGDWGCEGIFLPCYGDANGDNVVDVLDVVEVIQQWGPC